MAAKFKIVGKLPFISKKEVSQTKNFDKLMSRMEAEKVPESVWSGKRLTAMILAGVLVVSLGVGITVYQLTGDSEQLTDNSGQLSVSREQRADNSKNGAVNNDQKAVISEQETVSREQVSDNSEQEKVVSDQLTLDKEEFQVSDNSLEIEEIVSNKLKSEQTKTAENLENKGLASIASNSNSKINKTENTSGMYDESSLELEAESDHLSDEQTTVLDYEKAQPIVGFDSLYSYFASAINYPDSLRPQQVYGKVVVEFVINKSGKAEQVKVLESLHPDLDKEAVRVVKQMPNWTPTKVYGEPIASKMSIPITFQLK
ncbi:energy transducer TonB [Chondrinema litorale]|uniref:energy transducer TonB n=1 Tax=Chondrinema litorale TaxID=2994555 RepID=UPI00254309EB|nr:energy transducer TonB [Chondrinema litorale]UZR96569.1 energy transducer TonB [Chondrinema litorale]